MWKFSSAVNRKGHYLFLSFLGLFLVSGCYLVHRKMEKFSIHRHRSENLLYLPSGQYLRPLTLGFQHLAADLLWIKAVGYFGHHAVTDQNYPWLYHLLDLITTLDPSFQQAYEFGGVLLSLEEGNITQSNALLRKGIQNFPYYWRFYFYLGFNYFFYLNDPAAAAPYIQKAASLPDHPTYLPHLAASLYAASHQPEVGLELLVSLYQNTGDTLLKQEIGRKIVELCLGNLPKPLQKYSKSL